MIDGGARYTHEALQTTYRGSGSDGSVDHDYNWIDYAYHNKEARHPLKCQFVVLAPQYSTRFSRVGSLMTATRMGTVRT